MSDQRLPVPYKTADIIPFPAGGRETVYLPEHGRIDCVLDRMELSQMPEVAAMAVSTLQRHLDGPDPESNGQGIVNAIYFGYSALRRMLA